MRAAIGVAALLVAAVLAVAWAQLVQPSLDSRRGSPRPPPTIDDGGSGTSTNAPPNTTASALPESTGGAMVATTAAAPPPHVSPARLPAPPPSPSSLADGASGWNGIAMEVNTDPAQYVVSPKYHVSPLEALPRSWPLKQSKSKVVARFALQYPGFARRNRTEAKGAGPKKVWIDVGARVFDKGSTLWFIRYYPGAAKENGWTAALFDVHDFSDKYPANVRAFFSGGFDFFAKAVWLHDRGVEVKGLRMSHVKERGKADPQDAALIKGRPDPRPSWTIDSVDLAAWLRARYTLADFVVLKMDIEGGEWEVLAHLIETGAIALVDELMLECHARVPGVHALTVHQSCIDLTNHIRKQGVAAHLWF
jgi:FkbM family methyltransferase